MTVFPLETFKVIPKGIHCKLEKSNHCVVNFFSVGQSPGILENQESEYHLEKHVLMASGTKSHTLIQA